MNHKSKVQERSICNGNKYLTYNTCTEKIKQMERDLKEMKKLSQIQFDFRVSKFEHYTVNQIQDELKQLEYLIDKLKKDLEKVKDEEFKTNT